jgi:hypothetical protein
MSAVAHAPPAAPSLLAPVAALPHTLTGPSGAIGQTGSILVHTVTGLTHTTTALTQEVGELGGSVIGVTRGPLTGPSGAIGQTGSILVHTVTGLTDTTTALTQTVGELSGSVIGVSRGALGGLAALTGTVGTIAAEGPTAVPTVSLAPGTSADRFPAAAPTPALPVLLGGLARDPVPGGVAPARLTGSGAPSAPWLTVDAATGPLSRHGLPAAPAPWEPAAPAAPGGTAGVTAGSGVSVLTGALTDPLTLAAMLTVLVLIACGRRWAWWFPEVAVGPD